MDRHGDGPLAPWAGLAVFGVLLTLLGLVVGWGFGSAAVVAGFCWFLGTAVLAGAEQRTLATALGASGIVWTSAGIAVLLRVDPSPWGSLVGFEPAGIAALVVAAWEVTRSRAAGRRGDPARRPPTSSEHGQ